MAYVEDRDSGRSPLKIVLATVTFLAVFGFMVTLGVAALSVMPEQAAPPPAPEVSTAFNAIDPPPTRREDAVCRASAGCVAWCAQGACVLDRNGDGEIDRVEDLSATDGFEAHLAYGRLFGTPVDPAARVLPAPAKGTARPLRRATLLPEAGEEQPF